MNFTPSSIGGLVVATCFAAGLNVYATILTLGTIARLHWMELPPGLDILGSWPVLIVSGILFAAEFVADKIPGLDLVWNAAHTFIRIPAAALLAYRASEHLSPGMQLLATGVGAAIAMATHSSKTALRGVVTPSPEPVSNIALSTSEDAAAIGLSYAAVHHPLISGSVALGCIVVAILCLRWIVKRIHRAWTNFNWRSSLGLDKPATVTLQK